MKTRTSNASGCGLACLILFSCCAAGQESQKAKALPVPKKITAITEAAGLGMKPGDYELLRKAADPIIKDVDECEDTYKFEDGNTALVELGTLGTAVILRMSGACICGATGNCPLVVFVRANGEYRVLLQNMGWGYAVVNAKAAVPDIAFASHLSGTLATLVFYRYTNKSFTCLGVEDVSSRGEGPWSGPFSVVDARPCLHFARN